MIHEPYIASFHRAAASEDGFSLTELMIVLVVIGILAMLAIPRFLSVTTEAKMAEAKLMLKQLHTLEEAYYYANDRYADNLAAVGFEQARLQTDGGTARYLIAIERADGASFMAAATSIVDFDKDGVFNVWEVNQDGSIAQRVAD